MRGLKKCDGCLSEEEFRRLAKLTRAERHRILLSRFLKKNRKNFAEYKDWDK